MAGGYNNLGPGSGGIKVGVVGGGHDGDSPQDQSSNQKILNPLLHGSGVSLDDLMHSGLSLTPSQFGQQSFPGALDPGTVIYYLAQEGMNGGIILGMANMLKDGGQGGGIGGSELGGQNLQQLRQTKLKINSPPKIQETTERGAKVKKAQETGEQHRLELLDGLPIHGALFQMAGFRLPEMPNIPTAKQKGSQMMNKDVLEKMAGQLQSIGGMFQGLLGKGGGNAKSSNFGNFAGNYGQGANNVTAGFTDFGGNTVFFSTTGKSLNVRMSKANTSNGPGTVGWGNTGNNRMEAIYKKVPPHIKKALKSLTILTQGEVGTGPLEFIPGNIVHPNTYLKNAENLLSQVDNLDDLMRTLQRLEYDTSLFGQENLKPVEISTTTLWGPAKKQYYANGYVNVVYSKPAQNNINAFSNLMFNVNASPGFTSLPAGTQIVPTKINLPLLLETGNTINNAKLAVNTKNTKNSISKTVEYYILPTQSAYFQETIRHTGNTTYTLKNQYELYSLNFFAGTGDIPNYTVNTLAPMPRGPGDDTRLNLNVDFTANNEKSITLLSPTAFAKNTIFTVIGTKKIIDAKDKQEKFTENFTSDGKTVNYNLKNKYIIDKETITITEKKPGSLGFGQPVILKKTDYTAKDGKTFTLKKVPAKGSIIIFNGVKDTVIVIPGGGSGGGSDGSGGAGGGGSGGGGSGGGGVGQNIMGQMFGKSSGIMKELMQRLPQQGERESAKMTQKLNHGQDAQKLMEVAKKTINGGDPLSKDLFS